MDGQEQTPVVPESPVAGEATPPSEPVDLTQAFQLLRETDNLSTPPAVEAGEPAEPAGVEPEPAAEPAMPAAPVEPAVPSGPEPSQPAGGSSASQQGTDYQALGQGLINQIREQARRETLKDFQDHNIKLVSINDIYERGEDGVVKFNNPDDPRRPFESRAAAQAWVDSINNQINAEYQNRIAKRAGELWKESQPTLQMYQFAPYYERMDDTSKRVFDQLLDGREIKDKTGRVIGYDCNLAQVAAQAIKITQSFAPQQKATTPAPQQTTPATTPAMDIKAGTGEATDDEPKTIEEAMAMLNKQKKEKKNG